MASKRIMITLGEAVMRKLEQLAKVKGVSKSVLITLALEEYDARKGGVDEE